MITYALAMKTDRMTATRDAVASGSIELRDSGDNVLVTYDLTASGGTVSGDTWTLAVDTSGVAATLSGTADNAVIKNSGDSILISGLDIGTSGSGAAIIIDNTSIAAGQTVSFVSATIQHAADPV